VKNEVSQHPNTPSVLTEQAEKALAQNLTAIKRELALVSNSISILPSNWKHTRTCTLLEHILAAVLIWHTVPCTAALRHSVSRQHIKMQLMLKNGKLDYNQLILQRKCKIVTVLTCQRRYL